ncbi:hypothetical protein TNCV_382711 [Trichonephila clavipes]|nr:hypothetical protein TNCV_382711 [Trichonephila clavipes]
MKMISGGGRKRVPAPLTLCETRREGNDRCCADRLQPRKFNIGSRVGEQMARSRSEMSSWVHGKISFLVVVQQDRDSDQKSTVRSVARENL